MPRLPGIDAAFVYAETGANHFHITAVVVVDPSGAPQPFDAATVRRLVANRLDRLPAFRRRLVERPLGLAPQWVDVADLDLDYHVRGVSVGPGAGLDAVADFASDVASRSLDRRRPLWELWVVNGLADGYAALVGKVHHALIDGIAAVGILGALVDLEPTPVPDAPATLPEPAPAPFVDPVAELREALVEKPLHALRTADRFIRSVTRATVRARLDGATPALPLRAPRTLLNRAVTPGRRVALTTVPLDDVRRVRQAFGATFHEVVTATVSVALRRWLVDRDDLPEQRLVAAVPVSLDLASRHVLGNRISVMFSALPVDLDDPVACMAAVRRELRDAKRLQRELGPAALVDIADAAPWTFVRPLLRAYTELGLADRTPPVVNLVLSSVPGPPMPLSLAGARIVNLFPMGPIFDGTALNVTVVSYEDGVGFGLMADRAIPEVAALADAIPDALTALVKAAEVLEEAGPAGIAE